MFELCQYCIHWATWVKQLISQKTCAVDIPAVADVTRLELTPSSKHIPPPQRHLSLTSKVFLTRINLLSVKLSYFIVWRHAWRKYLVKCAVLKGNNAGLRTVLTRRLSHTQLRSSFRESHSFLSLPAGTKMASSKGTDKNWQKADKLMGNLCCTRDHSVHFFAQFFLHS
jgi:hypothetical protein